MGILGLLPTLSAGEDKDRAPFKKQEKVRKRKRGGVFSLVMVLRSLGVRGCQGIAVISRVLAVLASAAAVLSLMHQIFPGGDGRRRITIFAEASGGLGGGGNGFFASSSSNVGIAIAVTAMAGLALAATIVYSSRR
ncbi:hypothetical protein Salat_1893700 [Sesamum alatum]|uniref:Uncharacterized protein n=1 Tax=Sesamum alatum TaxID=300844 RepID=A0AAE2CI66_9LAMI|nr:hypothetical protein Salat_1893700 [Sesamum alatum]